MSITEAEYMATMKAGKEIICMKDFISELGIKGRSISYYTVIKVPSTLPRKLPTIRELSTSNRDIPG